jgi:hypothetical protein
MLLSRFKLGVEAETGTDIDAEATLFGYEPGGRPEWTSTRDPASESEGGLSPGLGGRSLTESSGL